MAKVYLVSPMRRGNETHNANLDIARSLSKISEVFLNNYYIIVNTQKCIQNGQSITRRCNETPNTNLAFGQSLYILANVVCAAVMKHLTLTWILAKVNSE